MVQSNNVITAPSGNWW